MHNKQSTFKNKICIPVSINNIEVSKSHTSFLNFGQLLA